MIQADFEKQVKFFNVFYTNIDSQTANYFMLILHILQLFVTSLKVRIFQYIQKLLTLYKLLLINARINSKKLNFNLP